jgi:hypothetical protein
VNAKKKTQNIEFEHNKVPEIGAVLIADHPKNKTVWKTGGFFSGLLEHFH